MLASSTDIVRVPGLRPIITHFFYVVSNSYGSILLGIPQCTFGNNITRRDMSYCVEFFFECPRDLISWRTHSGSLFKNSLKDLFLILCCLLAHYPVVRSSSPSLLRSTLYNWEKCTMSTSVLWVLQSVMYTFRSRLHSTTLPYFALETYLTLATRKGGCWSRKLWDASKNSVATTGRPFHVYYLSCTSNWMSKGNW